MVNIIKIYLKKKGQGNSVSKMIDDANRRYGGDMDGNGTGGSGQSSQFENITNIQDSQTVHHER